MIIVMAIFTPLTKKVYNILILYTVIVLPRLDKT